MTVETDVAAVSTPPEQRVLLSNSTWETYERLLAENVESLGTRFAYDEGMLEIMIVSAGHESPNRTLAVLVELVGAELRKDVHPAGSVTLKRKDLEKGFEPDSCFYFRNVERMRKKDEIDLASDPPPDLVIEVDITRSSLDRFRIFGAVGVPEVWRYDGEQVLMYLLDQAVYTESSGECRAATSHGGTSESVRRAKPAPKEVRMGGRRARMGTAISVLNSYPPSSLFHKDTRGCRTPISDR